MTKNEFIKRYGEEAYELKLEQTRNWKKRNRERHNAVSKTWQKQNSERYKANVNDWFKEQRKLGWSVYCKENYEQIENYDIAKVDEFDPKKWELHHKKEEFFSAKTLKDYNMYFDVQPEDLIWLPKNVHRSDAVVSSYDPTKSEYHQKKLEIWGKNLEEYKKRHSRKASATWKTRPEYIACEGKHQLQDHEQFKQYQLEYQREYRKTHSEYYRIQASLKRLPKQIEAIQNKLNDPDWLMVHTPEQVENFRLKLERYKRTLDEFLELKNTNTNSNEKVA